MNSVTSSAIRRIKPLAHKWARTLGIDQWDLRIDVAGERAIQDSHDRTCVFEVSSDWRYFQAHITGYAPAIAELDDESLERALAHEMVHIILGELTDCHEEARMDHEERVARVLANALIKARNLGRQNKL